MPCDTRVRANQTLTERKEEIKTVIENLARLLASGRVKAVVSKQGAIAFNGLTDAERNGVTDACAYRRIMATGSQSAKLAIMRAEQLAGVTVNKQVLTTGLHSHDGGGSWHPGHKHHH